MPRPLLPLLAVLFLLISACATGDDQAEEVATDATETPTQAGSPADADVLSRAAEATADQRTARVEITTVMDDPAGQEQTLSNTAEGVVDFDSAQRRITFEGPQGTLDVIFDGATVYVEMPGTEDERWIEVEAERLGAQGLNLTQPGALPAEDPQATLRFLQTAEAEVEEIGEEDVRGESTTHYRTTIDVQAAADAADPEVRAALEQSLRQSGVSELDMEVWVDDDELIRRVRYILDLSQVQTNQAAGTTATPATTGTMTVQIEYFDFGADVDIEIPSGDAVIKLDEDAIQDTFQGAPATTGTEARTEATVTPEPTETVTVRSSPTETSS